MSIKLKLTILFIAIVFIPLFFISSLVFVNYRSSLEHESLSSLESIATLKEHGIASFFRTLKTNITIAQGYWNIKKNMPTIMKYIDQQTNPDYRAAKQALDNQLVIAQKEWKLFDIMLVSPEGLVVYCSNPRHEEEELGKKPLEFSSKELGEAKKEIRFSEITRNPFEGNKFGMAVATPVYDFENNFIGEVVFSVDMEPLYTLTQDVTGLGETGETLLAKKIGDELIFLNPLRHDPQAALRRKVVLGDKVAYPIQQAVLGKNGTGITLDYRGKEVIASWHYLSSVGWGMVTKIDAQEAFGPVVDLGNITTIAIIVVTIIVVILSLAIAKSIADPIHALHEGALTIGQGNLDYRVGTQEKDEIGELSRSFDQMAANLKNYQAKLVQSEKFAFLGKLAGFVSHELKNPLGVMKNVVYYFNMLGLGKDNVEVKENLDILSSEIEKSDQIITDLLGFSRTGNPNLHPENINIIVDEILNRLHINPHIEVVKQLQDDLPHIEVDALHIHQIFYNIARNALEAMEENGGALKIATARVGDFIEATFSDTGSGIPKENLDKLFEPLFSTKAKGTGFGLAICSALVSGHNGTIEVRSEVGKGTTFIVKLPIRGVYDGQRDKAFDRR